MRIRSEKGKKEKIRNMFNSISGSYDFLNHFLSFGIDFYWRKKIIRKMGRFDPRIILDAATGTGDLAIAARKINPEKIIGVDIAESMLEIAGRKIRRRRLSDLINLLQGDSEDLPFGDNMFDSVMVGFGVRNFEDLDRGLSEIYRVLKNDGRIWVLELSEPGYFPVKQLYRIYFKKITPMIGRAISKDRSAYSYLPDSIEKFPSGERFLQHLNSAGFTELKRFPSTFGVASIYCGKK